MQNNCFANNGFIVHPRLLNGYGETLSFGFFLCALPLLPNIQLFVVGLLIDKLFEIVIYKLWRTFTELKRSEKKNNSE